MGFHAPKNKKPPVDLNSGSVTMNLFKSIVIEMKKRGSSDDELEVFANDPKPESLGLKPDPYRDAMFVQIKERTTPQERFDALRELADQGKI